MLLQRFARFDRPLYHLRLPQMNLITYYILEMEIDDRELGPSQTGGQGAAALEKYSIMRERALLRITKSRFSSKSNISDRNVKETFIKQRASQPQPQEKYWGTLKPYYFNPSTQVPRIIISKTLLRSLLINLLIIFVVCIWIPVTTNHSMFRQALSPRGFNRLLTDSVPSLQGDADPLSTSYSARYIARKYSLYIFSGIWSSYELFFLAMLLLGNPGYGQLAQGKQLSLQEQVEIGSTGQKNLYGLNKCSTCRAIVDNSVYHCPICDLCCEGFSHHCEWIGKCVGYKNQIFLKAYYYGFFIGLAFFVLVIVLQSIPISAS